MAIVLSSLTKSYGDQLVVNNLDLNVKPSELFVLLGSSGSGKSTVLRLIAGLTNPDAGTICMGGKDVTNVTPQKRGVGFVFQNYALFAHMDVRANVEFGLKIRSVNKAQRKERCDELLQLVGLLGFGNRFPAELSGGQRQRVALARALAYEPSVLLLDEPFGALDQKIRLQLRRSLKDIQNKLGMTMLLVTHDQEEAFELGDRIAVLERGRLLECATPYELYHTPSTEQVAIFVGGGNLLVGRSEQDSTGKSSVRLGSILLPLDHDAQEAGSAVRVLMRPECLSIELDPPANNDALSLGQALITESYFSGAVQRVRLEVPALKGVRPLAPALTSAQRNVLLEVAIPSVTPNACFLAGSQCYVHLKHYHILPRAGMRFLIATDAFAENHPAMLLGVTLVRYSHGFGTILNLGPSTGDKLAVAKALEAGLRQSQGDSLAIEIRASSGSRRKALLRAVQEGWFDLVVLERKLEHGALTARTKETLHALLFQARVPVIFAGITGVELKRIIVCTAAGEPGKSLVYFAGRLARHSQAEVNIMHVVTPDTSDQDLAQVKEDLEQDCSMLELFNVRKNITVVRGQPKNLLVKAARDCDLLVVGAPGNQNAILSDQQGFFLTLISTLNCNLAVVPMKESS